jgi:hypothetical protein
MSQNSEVNINLMSGLIFYRQKRFDGGIRTGVELGSVTILEHFEAGERERDPALLWYVDVRCEGSGLPTDTESARHWFIDTKNIVERELSRFADHLRQVGADPDEYPLEWTDFPEANEGVTWKISCSLIRRIDARGLAEILDDVRLHWSDRLQAMIEEQIEYSPRG